MRDKLKKIIHNKKGISLIALIVTIIAIIIISAITIFNTNSVLDSTGLSKFKSDFSDFRTAVFEAHQEKVMETSIKVSDKEIYYMMAKNEDGDESGIDTISDIKLSDLGLALSPSPLNGEECYEITDDRNISKWNENKGYYTARSDEHHYITDAGEVFILPGYKVEEDGVTKWYVNDSKWYVSGSGIAVGTDDNIGNTYTVYYVASDGLVSGSMEPQEFVYGTPQNLRTNEFTKTGYRFSKWNTAIDGSGTSYSQNQKVNNLVKENGGSINLYTVWEANAYTATFDGNGGTSGGNIRRKNGEELGELPTSIRTNYTFDGWFTEAVGGTEVLSSTKMGAEDVTYYAHWNENTRTATFDGNGGSPGASIIKHTGEPLGTLPETSRVGHNFLGWYTAATGGTQITSSTKMPANNVTYYAHWSVISYTASFNGNGGSNGSSITKNYNEVLGVLPTSTRDDYTFDGWYTEQESGTKISNSTRMPAENKTYYAHWIINQYTATFNGNGGDDGTSITRAYNVELGELPTTSRTGYTFVGWFTASEGGTQISASTKMPSGGTTYYAHWSVISYTATFNSTGGTEVESITRNFDEMLGTLTIPTKTGYNFAGWYTEQTSGTHVVATTKMPAQNVTYYAHWNPKTNTPYTVKHYQMNIDGSTYDLSDTVNMTGTTGESVTPIVRNYDGFTAPSAQTVTIAADGSTVVEYNYIRNEYTAIFDSHGGSSVASKTKLFGVALGELTEPTRTGYMFGGWYTEENDGEPISSTTTMPVGGATYHAHWTGISYSVAFDKNATDATGTMDTQTGFVYGTPKAISSNAFTRTGYTFAGWAKIAEGNVEYSDGESISNGATTNGATLQLYAKWTANTYSVAFDKNADEATGEMELETGFVYGIPKALTVNAFTRTGYTFAGWAKTAGGNVEYSNGESISNGATTNGATLQLYAKWTANTYTVSFDAGDEVENPPNITVTYGSTYGNLPDVIKTGYTFEGWYTAPTGGTKVEKTDTVTIVADQTLFAHWTGVSYSVEFNKNAADATGTMDTQNGFVFGTPKALTTNAFTRTGYTFAGWAKSAGGEVVYTNGQSITDGTTTNGATVTLYAKWTVNTYTVSFDAGDGVINPANITVTYGSTYGSLPVVIKTGYTFDGWYTLSTDGTKIEETDIVTIVADQTLYAHWIPIVSHVTYEVGEEGTVSPTGKDVTYDAPYGELPDNATREGYTFVGWYTEEVGGNPVTVATIVKAVSNHSIYAHWNVNQYTATFDGNDGSSIEPITRNYGEALGALTDSSRTGYKFEGWYTERTGGTKVTSSTTMPAYDVIYYAHWTINQYTASFEGNGGADGASITKNYNEALGELPGSSKTGHEFLGWFTEVNGGTQVTEETLMPPNDVIYHAHWSVNQYTVILDGNGGDDGADIVKNYGELLGTLPPTTRAGYSFVGWFTERVGGTEVPNNQTMPENGATYYAHWEINQYIASFDGNDGSDGTPITRDYNQVLGELPDSERAGYTHAGWYTERIGGDRISSTTKMPNHDVTYYAHWTINQYTANFEGNGGSDGAPITKDYNTALGKLSTSSRTGHTFVGWFTEVNEGTQVTESTLMPPNDVIYHAHWTVNGYTASFNGNGGTNGADRQVYYDTQIGELPTSTRTGYTFAGWFTESSGDTQISSTTRMPAQDTTYYAHWTVNQYTASFDGNGGSDGTPITKDYGQPLGKLPTTSRTGYHFDGWFTHVSGGTEVTSATTMPADNVMYHAQWTANTYHVTYEVGEDATVSPTGKDVTFDAAYGALPASPTRPGYTFAGWYTAAIGGTEVTSATIVSTASDHSIYAHWTSNMYTVEYRDGSTLLGSSMHIPGEGKELTSITTLGGGHEGYTFAGWCTTQNGLSRNYNDCETVTDIAAPRTTISLYAVYSRQIVATFYITADNSRTETQTGTQYYNPNGAYTTLSVTMPVVSDKKTECVFSGWSSDGGETVLTAGTTEDFIDNIDYYTMWEQVDISAITATRGSNNKLTINNIPAGLVANVWTPQRYSKFPNKQIGPSYCGANPGKKVSFTSTNNSQTIPTSTTSSIKDVYMEIVDGYGNAICSIKYCNLSSASSGSFADTNYEGGLYVADVSVNSRSTNTALSRKNGSGAPSPSIATDTGIIDFDLRFKLPTSDPTFYAIYNVTIFNDTMSDYEYYPPDYVPKVYCNGNKTDLTGQGYVTWTITGITSGTKILAGEEKVVQMQYNLIDTFSDSAHRSNWTIDIDKTGGMDITENINPDANSRISVVVPSTTGDLTDGHTRASYSVEITNEYSTEKTVVLSLNTEKFVIVDENGNQPSYTIGAAVNSETPTVRTYTFYLEKAPGEHFSAVLNSATVYFKTTDADETVRPVPAGTVYANVTPDVAPSDMDPPLISNVKLAEEVEADVNNPIRRVLVTWDSSDESIITHYTVILTKTSNNTTTTHEVYNDPDNGKFAADNFIYIDGLTEDATYYATVYGIDSFDKSGEDYVGSATTSEGYACKSADTLVNWEFTVTPNLTSVTKKSGSNTAYRGYSYTATFTRNKNSWSTFEITVGTKKLSSPQYADSSSDRTITIPASELTGTINGNITIKLESTDTQTCLVEGTPILLADGTYKNVEDIQYTDLLAVYNHVDGGIANVYPLWIEDAGTTEQYEKLTFSDGSELKISNSHCLFDVDERKYVDMLENWEKSIGRRVLKYENGKLNVVTVTDIEFINEPVKFYNVVATRYYNVLANGFLTEDILAQLSNIYGYNSKAKYSLLYTVISNIEHLEYSDVSSFMPHYLFEGLNFKNAKLLMGNGLDVDLLIDYLDRRTLPPISKNGALYFRMTTSLDDYMDTNNERYLYREGSLYTLPITGAKYFIETSTGTRYNPGDAVMVDYSMHFEAVK